MPIESYTYYKANGADTSADTSYSSYHIEDGIYASVDPTDNWGWVYSGYTFSHWNTSADGTGTSIQVGETPVSRGTYDGQSVYAIWTPAGGVAEI